MEISSGLSAGALSVDAAIGVGDALDGWVGAGVVAGGVATAAAQAAPFFRPREGAEAQRLRRHRAIPVVYFRFVP